MKNLLSTVAMILSLTLPAIAQDLGAGFAAYQTGDYTAALREWQPLAEAGDAAAQFLLGFMYSNGEGVPQDDAQAVAWFQKAAEQGHAKAQYNLGYMYTIGRGVPQDIETAHVWFNLAAAQGDERAIKVSDIVAKDLTPAQLANAQARARACLASQYQNCD